MVVFVFCFVGRLGGPVVNFFLVFFLVVCFLWDYKIIDEDAIAAWVPHLIQILIRALMSFENSHWDVDVDPMCHAFFPTWFAFMNAHVCNLFVFMLHYRVLFFLEI